VTHTQKAYEKGRGGSSYGKGEANSKQQEPRTKQTEIRKSQNGKRRATTPNFEVCGLFGSWFF
jgi:hypothetical protein